MSRLRGIEFTNLTSLNNSCGGWAVGGVDCSGSALQRLGSEIKENELSVVTVVVVQTGGGTTVVVGFEVPQVGWLVTTVQGQSVMVMVSEAVAV